MFKIACGHCGKRMAVPENAIGQVGQCPHCGAQVAILSTPPSSKHNIQSTKPQIQKLHPWARSIRAILRSQTFGIAAISGSISMLLVYLIWVAFFRPASPPVDQANDVPATSSPDSNQSESNLQANKPPAPQPAPTNPLPLEAPKETPTPAAKVPLKPVEIAAVAEPSIVLIHAFCSTDGNGDAFGSGFILAPGNVIITNAHVVEGAFKLEITTSDKRTGTVDYLLALDKNRDIAVLPLPLEFINCPGLKLASDLPRTGEAAYAYGSPLGLDNTFTAGIVSKVRTDGLLGVWENVALIQMDTPISHGSSGGPLLNEFAEIIGVNSVVVNPAIASNLNFAIASTEVAVVVADLTSPPAQIRLISEETVRQREIKKTLAELIHVPKERNRQEAEKQAAQQATAKKIVKPTYDNLAQIRQLLGDNKAEALKLIKTTLAQLDELHSVDPSLLLQPPIDKLLSKEVELQALFDKGDAATVEDFDAAKFPTLEP